MDVKNITFKKKGSSTVSQLLDRQTDNAEGDVAKILAGLLPISLPTAPNRCEDAHGNRNL